MWWPPRDTQQKLSGILTVYGFWIGIALAVLAILLVYDISQTRIVAKPNTMGPTVDPTQVEIIWEKNYLPANEIEEALKDMLMGETYEQPRYLDDDIRCFFVPESIRDLDRGRCPWVMEAEYQKWRAVGVPPLEPDKTPSEMKLPLSGREWEWNIDDEVMKYIVDQSESTNETAWYKIAIAMVGGYSEQISMGPSSEERKDAIDKFLGAKWTFNATYRVWNEGNASTEASEIILGCQKDIKVRPPAGMNYKRFIIEPGIDNQLEFKFVPLEGLDTLDAAENLRNCIKEQTSLFSPIPQPIFVIKWPLQQALAGAIGGGAVIATLMMILFGLRHRRQK